MKDLPYTECGAYISACSKYRYLLWRRWSADPFMTWLMLNPSTADGAEDDATIRRCVGFALARGCGGIRVINLFALRATDPAKLLAASDPVGDGNDAAISLAIGSVCSYAVAGWGAPSGAGLRALVSERARRVIGVVPHARLTCFGATKDGSPRHPLYLPGNAELRAWAPKSGGEG